MNGQKCPTLMKTSTCRFSKLHRPSRVKTKKAINRHFMAKLLKTKDETELGKKV